MRAGDPDEADILAAMFVGRRSSTDAAPPPVIAATDAVATPPKGLAWRILTATAFALAALLAAGLLIGAYGEAWAASVQTGAMVGAMLLIALVSARVAGTHLLGAGRHVGLWSAVGAGMGLGALLWCVLALALGQRLVPDGSPGGPVAAAGAIVTLAQVSGEEVLFRGWMQPALGRLLPGGTAAFATAALFALMHVPGGWQAPLSIVNILLAGWWLGLLADRSAGLAAPIAAHWGWNAGEMNLFGLFPNPGVGAWGALAGRDISGAAVWGGSVDGLNASVVMTLVMAAMVLALLARQGQRR